METTIALDELAERTAASFQKRFGRPARYVVAAPGRVNIIGEHTDYNDGFVLPMAIDRYTVIAADVEKEPDRHSAEVTSMTLDQQVVVPLAGSEADELPIWAKYIRGVFDTLAEQSLQPPGFDAVIDSTVPLGGGLSSSAALEVATATLLEELTGKHLEPVQKALLCQRAENEGAGMPCGIMDQFSSTLCQAGHLMLLDCRSQQPRMVPLADPSVMILIINSNVKHELTGGEYAERRTQCEEAAKKMELVSLRDANSADLEKHKPELKDVLYRRAKHVISEIERTTAAAAAIEAGQWEAAGKLMYESHASLRDDFEVSCSELDVLVASAEKLGVSQGVYGSRMTGGGFGGCTVSLVKSEQAGQIAAAICAEYRKRTDIEATAFATPPAQGAQVLTSGKPLH